nr:rho gdp-dissociation inhibitor 1 [Quercus suber]
MPGATRSHFAIQFRNNSKRILFTLKEGNQYCLKFSFTVSNNIVLGLKYTNVVWKTSMKVDNSKRMLGTFSPQQEPYTSEMEEETTPSGMFARGTYSARTKFVDDDGKCYLDIDFLHPVLKKDMDVYQLQWYGYCLFRALACLHKQVNQKQVIMFLLIKS